MIIKPHDYQIKIIYDASLAFRSGSKGVLIWMPTGSGKTIVATDMIQKIIMSDPSKKVWFNVHSTELIEQTARTFNNFGIKFGYIAAGFPEDHSRQVQVNSIMTLKNRFRKFQAPDWMFWDECHMMGAETWRNIYSEFPNTKHIGLSATPVRLDGKGFTDFFDVIVHGPTINQLIKDRRLSDYTVFCPTNLSTDGIKKVAGDFDSRAIAELMNNPTIVGDCLTQWQKYGSKFKTIAFSPNIEFSEALVRQFRQAGVNAYHVDGETPREDRKKIIRAYSEGSIQMLSNCNLFIAGFDVPKIGCIIDAAPTMSLARHIQKLGRGLRTAEGKEKLTVLDQWNGYLRHGLIDDERDWSLEGRKKANKAANKNDTPTKRCPSCYAANNSFNQYCTNCGFQFEIKKRTGPDQIDGDLTELDKAEFRKLRKKEEKKAQTYEELVEVGISRGYKNPSYWAKMKFNNGWRNKK